MASIIWLLLVVLSSSLSHFGAQGEMMSYSISKEEDLELERQLKILNKPPIKTVETEGGIFDCIDINNQPALDHPLLKNHKIQTSPTSRPKQLRDRTLSKEKHQRTKINSIGCPHGTVPIRRTQKEDLIRAKSYSKSSSNNINPQTPNAPGVHQAILRSKDIDNLSYLGVSAYINLYNVTVEPDQDSSAQMWIENGGTSIQFGWMVSPMLFGDTLTRLFTYWTTGDGDGCFNVLCPGYIQVSRDHVLGEVLSPTSTYKGDQYSIYPLVFQDANTGNWWLTMDDDNNIGYWPKTLFPKLDGGASYVAWGGSVKGNPHTLSAPMGNGHYPNKHWEACYFHTMQIINLTDYQVNPHEYNLEKYIDCPNCYDVWYKGYLGAVKGHAIMFGGPGGNCPP